MKGGAWWDICRQEGGGGNWIGGGGQAGQRWDVRVWAEMFSDSGGGAITDSFLSFFTYLLSRTQARLSVFLLLLPCIVEKEYDNACPFSSYPIWDFG